MLYRDNFPGKTNASSLFQEQGEPGHAYQGDSETPFLSIFHPVGIGGAEVFAVTINSGMKSW